MKFMYCTIPVCPVGWVMFLITGVMTIMTVYLLPNDALTFKKNMKRNMNAETSNVLP